MNISTKRIRVEVIMNGEAERPQELLRAKEVAERLAISVRALRRCVRAGLLPGRCGLGGGWCGGGRGILKGWCREWGWREEAG
jgi:hypothetical protein